MGARNSTKCRDTEFPRLEFLANIYTQPHGNGIECQNTTSHFKINFQNRFRSVAYTHESTNDQDLELAVNDWYCIDVEV